MDLRQKLPNDANDVQSFKLFGVKYLLKLDREIFLPIFLRHFKHISC